MSSENGLSVAQAQMRARARLAHLGETAALDAARILETVTGRDRAWLLAHGDAALARAAAAKLDELVAGRGAGTPLAYVLGEAGFYGRTFGVTADVLVPRPESELLVELALAFAERRGAAQIGRIADVGTGSGVLAITLALALPAAFFSAIDASPTALVLAARNARAHGAEQRIAFAAGDAFEQLEPAACFDIVVANLPYVRTCDLPPAPDPTSFEPRLALDGGADGLAVYRRLLARAPRHVAGGGALFLEAGPESSRALAALGAGAFGAGARVSVHRDYAGLERVVAIELPEGAPWREGPDGPTKADIP